MKNFHEAITNLPMKDMDSVLLVTALQAHLADVPLSEQERADIARAIVFAAYLHREDQRHTPTRDSSGKVHTDFDPYIVHPLRNTVRLVRWGISNADAIIASLLHDVVEDHAFDIYAEFVNEAPAEDVSEDVVRAASLNYIREQFNENVAVLVEYMSNPIIENFRNVPVVERNAIYALHVSESLSANAYVYWIKFADFVDNALSAHHGKIDRYASRRSRKYLPLVAMFQKHLEENSNGVRDLVHESAVADVHKRLSRADDYLLGIINEHPM